MRSHYQNRIAEIVPDLPAAHIEAWMRLERGTLDGLSPEQFATEVRVGAELARSNPAESAELARSYGL